MGKNQEEEERGGAIFTGYGREEEVPSSILIWAEETY